MGVPKGKRDFRDLDQLGLSERHAVEYFMKAWGVTKDQITAAEFGKKR